VIKVGIIPKNNPIKTESTTSYKKPFKPSKITKGYLSAMCPFPSFIIMPDIT